LEILVGWITHALSYSSRKFAENFWKKQMAAAKVADFAENRCFLFPIPLAMEQKPKLKNFPEKTFFFSSCPAAVILPPGRIAMIDHPEGLGCRCAGAIC